MDTLLLLIIVLVTSFIATLLSSMSGGGSSIIAVPIWLSLGFSYPLAAAIQLVNNTFWVLPASRNYLRKVTIDWKFLITFATIGLFGVIGGVFFILSISKQALLKIIGAIIITLVFFVFFKKDFGTTKRKITNKLRRFLAYPCALCLGFYESFFGSGNGIFLSAVTIYSRGFVFKEALGYYYAIAFPWAILGASLLISKGYYNLPIMITAVVGSVMGGYLGSKYGAYKGNRFIKTLFCIIGFILGVKLLIGM